MSGISGKIVFHGIVTFEEVTAAAHTLRHRGPNGTSFYISENQKIGLAQSNLILSHQSSADILPLRVKHISIVADGYIYNADELREQLSQLGAQFSTLSDKEVIAWGYIYWGVKVLEQLHGMFAIVIHDSHQNEVFLARDRMGMKPLFYAFQNQALYFGSEVKAIHSYASFQAQINPESISLFLANRFVSNQQSMWSDIQKLPAAHYMLVDASSLKFSIHRYWSLPLKTQKVPDIEVQKTFEELLQRSISKHLNGHDTVGAFLSGGLDSSATVTMMQLGLQYPTQAFSIGFEKWSDSEHQHAEVVAQKMGAELRTLMLDKIDLKIMPTLMHHYDDPIADISILPSYAVSQLASQHVQAIISGEGADELLGGYWWHRPECFHPWNGRLRSWWNRLLSKKSDYTPKTIKQHYIHAMSMGLFDKKELKKALQGSYKKAIPTDVFGHLDELFHAELTPLKQIQYLDVHHFMSELVFTKIERASMAHGLQVRAPFLDHELAEWLFSLPEEQYFQIGVQKPLIQNYLKGKVPESILQRPKQGFVGPDVFYKNFELYKKTLTGGRLINEGVIRASYLQQLFLKRDHWRLWKLFVLENWWQVWM